MMSFHEAGLRPRRQGGAGLAIPAESLLGANSFLALCTCVGFSCSFAWFVSVRIIWKTDDGYKKNVYIFFHC